MEELSALIVLENRKLFIDIETRGGSLTTPLSSTCNGGQRENNVRTGRAGVPKITNVALTLVVSGSRERSKLYGASRRMARARRGRDGPIVARSSPDIECARADRNVVVWPP